MNSGSASVDEYLASLDAAMRQTLTEVRRRVRAKAPEAVESISYGMPTFKYRGKPLVYFAAWKDHWGLYGTAKGTLRFAAGEALDTALLDSLLDQRLAEIGTGAATKKRPADGGARRRS